MTELLVTCQSEIATKDEGTVDISVNFHTIVDDERQTIIPLWLDEVNAISPSLALPELSMSEEPLAFQGLSDLERSPLGFTSSLPEGVGRVQPALLLSDASGFISYKLGVPDFLPENDVYSNSDGKTLPESSARHDQPHFSITQGSQEKVKCTWPGCSRAVKKDNLTRHVNEMHHRKVKAICTGCRKGFVRPYMLKGHVCQAKSREF
ncbi:hypothetical protein BDR04DRAFT_1106777 [Suillus decipiens]|nr:hypothetical protein BDR04DRAFT_1106777 [Suillus decipiens]